MANFTYDGMCLIFMKINFAKTIKLKPWNFWNKYFKHGYGFVSIKEQYALKFENIGIN